MSAHERERLCAFLDGELSAGERARVSGHLRACTECTALLAELAAADRAAAGLPAEAPEGYFEGFPARVLARVRARQAESRARRWPAWTWAAAAALLLAVATPLTVRRLRPVPAEIPVVKTPAPPMARERMAPVARADSATALARPAPPPAPALSTGGRPEEAPARHASEPPPAKGSGLPIPGSVGERDEAEGKGVFAREPAAETPPPSPGAPVATMADTAVVLEATEGATAPAALAPRGKGAGGRLSPEADETRVGSADRRAESSALGAIGPGGDADRRFESLHAVRPVSAGDWRLLRDGWAAFVAVHPDDPRADEARVRAIEAGHEAWRTGGSPEDDAGWRGDARAYLERADARQAERVRRLLTPRR